jgi:hypothetical protein
MSRWVGGVSVTLACTSPRWLTDISSITQQRLLAVMGHERLPRRCPDRVASEQARTASACTRQPHPTTCTTTLSELHGVLCAHFARILPRPRPELEMCRANGHPPPPSKRGAQLSARHKCSINAVRAMATTLARCVWMRGACVRCGCDFEVTAPHKPCAARAGLAHKKERGCDSAVTNRPGAAAAIVGASPK